MSKAPIRRSVVASLVIVVLAVGSVWSAVAQAGPTSTPTATPTATPTPPPPPALPRGSVVGWGTDNWGMASPPGTVNGVFGTAIVISANAYHTLAIVGAPEPTPTPSGRVAVCHNGKHSISVSADAATTHLTHGDALGACP